MADQQQLVPVFDGHNDTVMELLRGERTFYDRSETGHLDRVKAAEGGMVGGFFAIFVPDAETARVGKPELDLHAMVGQGVEGVQLSGPDGPSQAFSLQYTVAAISTLLRVESGFGLPDGTELDEDGVIETLLSFVTTAEELEENIESGQFSAILHFEGAEMIDEHFYALETFWQTGLRSLGPVWSRSNIFGHGVPFEFFTSPDTGPGLTDIGKELITACNDLGIMVDLSHMNEKGFWDIAGITDAPLVASHSNAWSICQATRNLTDKQLDAIAETNGVVGLNYNCAFVRPDCKPEKDTPLSMFADHVDYLVDKLSIDGVALGSDFDGALMPNDLADASMLPNLINELRGRGYDDASLRKIGYQNWVRVLRDTWGL
ncbi:MAG: dipeptidase [Thermomicrobiales bacterium]